MLPWFWTFPEGDLSLSRVDPFRLAWPDEFDRMARRMEEDMWRRQTILDAMDASTWRDYMMFFNNPTQQSTKNTPSLDQSISSSVEHFQNGKEHTFKRTVVVNGKEDVVTAQYDGEKTTVTYDKDKTLELPGFYDITRDYAKKDNEATRLIDEKLEQMNRQLREFATDGGQKSLEGTKQPKQNTIEGDKQKAPMGTDKHQQPQQMEQQAQPHQAS